jgi:hypothetical protein
MLKIFVGPVMGVKCRRQSLPNYQNKKADNGLYYTVADAPISTIDIFPSFITGRLYKIFYRIFQLVTQATRLGPSVIVNEMQSISKRNVPI